MNIDNLTIAQAREIASLFAGKTEKSCSFQIGENYLIRTVTMTLTGHLMNITDSDLELQDAAWIADTGRYATALQTGKLNEVEPYPGVAYVNRDAIVDFCVWEHPLPREQK